MSDPSSADGDAPEPPSPLETTATPEGRVAVTPGRVVLVVVLLGLLGLGAVSLAQTSRVNDLEDTRDEMDAVADQRREVSEAAGAFSEALLSYDYADLEAARARVVALATDDFAAQYSDAFTAGLSGSIVELKAVSKATVRTVYVGDIDGDKASAIVTLDSNVTHSAGTRRTVSQYLELTLVRVDGEWRVDTVTSVAALDEERTGPDGAPITIPDASSSTSTTASSSTTAAPDPN